MAKKTDNDVSIPAELKNLNSRMDRIEKAALLGAKTVLTTEDVSLLTGLSKRSIYTLISNGEIPHYKPEGRGKVYFKKNEIEDWLLQNRQKSNAEVNIEATTHTTLNPKKYVRKS